MALIKLFLKLETMENKLNRKLNTERKLYIWGLVPHQRVQRGQRIVKTDAVEGTSQKDKRWE